MPLADEEGKEMGETLAIIANVTCSIAFFTLERLRLSRSSVKRGE